MPADRTRPPPDMAYTAVLETTESGRHVDGWYLGLAKKDEPGYHQLTPGYGPYVSEKDAREHAAEMNERLGHTPESAFAVVASSMAAQS